MKGLKYLPGTICIFLAVMCFASVAETQTVVLEEHFPDDPTSRGWSASGTHPFTWVATEGDAGAMWTEVNAGMGTWDAEIVSPRFDTTGATDGEITFNWEKALNLSWIDSGLSLSYRVGGAGPWTDILDSGLGDFPWPQPALIDIGADAPGMLNQPVVELRGYFSIVNGSPPSFLMIHLTVDDVVVSVTSSGSPTPTPTVLPTATPSEVPVNTNRVLMIILLTFMSVFPVMLYAAYQRFIHI